MHPARAAGSLASREGVRDDPGGPEVALLPVLAVVDLAGPARSRSALPSSISIARTSARHHSVFAVIRCSCPHSS